MTTTAQDRLFLQQVISETLLEDAINWIANNMEPADVFSHDKLMSWASEVGLQEPD